MKNFINADHAHYHDDSCQDPWQYEEPMSVSETLLPYGGGGYIVKLGYDAATALMVKKNIEENNWLDEMSAAVILEFIVFDPADLLICDVMLLLEKFPTGTRNTRIDVTPQYIFPSSGSAVRTFYRVSILLWFIVILVLVVLEIVKVFKQGRAYFKRFFNWVSMLQILSSSCAVLTVFLKENSLKAFLQRIRDNPFGDWSAYQLVVWSSSEEVILSITVVLTTIKCLKLIQINRHVHVMKWTLQSASHYLCSFTVVILMLALAFAQLGTLLFGARDEEYATLYKSLRTVLKMAIGIGKIQFTKMSGDSELLAPLFLMACMLSMTIIFANTFIAILDEAFHQASDREHPGMELGAYMKSYFKNRIQKTNANKSNKRVFRKSPFRKSTRRKSSKQPPKWEVQQTEDVVAQQTKTAKLAESESRLSYESLRLHGEVDRAKLAESESLLSYESLSLHGDVDSLANIPSTQAIVSMQASPTGSNIEGDGTDTMCAETNKDGISKTKETLPTEEDLLLSDIAKIMKTVRSDFLKCLWEDKEWYTKSNSSFSSYDDRDSFSEMNESASMLSLIQTCQQEASNKQTWSYVRGMEKNRSNPIRRTLRRHAPSYAGSSRESHV